MIHLKIDGHIFSTEDWSEVEKLPGYLSDVDPTSIQLVGVMGYYQLKQKRRCGLSTCHTPHNNGVIASATRGEETVYVHVGKDCGRSKLHVEFDQFVHDFKNQVDRFEKTSRILEFGAKLDVYESRFQWVRYVAGNRLVRFEPRLLSLGPVRRQLITMRGQGSGAIVLERERSAEEIEVARTAGHDTSRYEEVVVGHLKGFDFLPQSLREITLRIESGLAQLSSLDRESSGKREIDRVAKWTSEAWNDLQQAESMVEKGMTLLQPENLAQLQQVVSSKEDKQELQAIIREAGQVVGKITQSQNHKPQAA